MQKYIVQYLYENTQDKRAKRFLDYMKIDLDIRLWSTGLQTPYSFEYEMLLRQWSAKQEAQLSVWKKLKRKIKSLVAVKAGVSHTPYSSNINSSYQHTWSVLSLVENISEENKKKIEEIGIELVSFKEAKNRFSSISKLCKWYNSLSHLSFNELLEEKHAIVLNNLYNEALNEVRQSDFNAVLVRTSELFYEKFFIDVFREIGRPSITLLHGLPAVYTKATESRSDYLLVWGNKIRENFIKAGYDPEHVIVAGNYKYTKEQLQAQNSTLRCSLSDVLILTSATYAEFQHEWEWEKFSVQDRSLLITYLYSIESVLKRCGVKHARLRPHPSVNKEWLADYVDLSFYQLDYEDFNTSLSKATLCIGQTSSTFLEALMSGVTYLVYEPGDGTHTISQGNLVPPFDGSEKALQVAYTERQLEQLIAQSYSPNKSILGEYLCAFEPGVLVGVLSDCKSVIYGISGGG